MSNQINKEAGFNVSTGAKFDGVNFKPTWARFTKIYNSGTVNIKNKNILHKFEVNTVPTLSNNWNISNMMIDTRGGRQYTIKNRRNPFNGKYGTVNFVSLI